MSLTSESPSSGWDKPWTEQDDATLDEAPALARRAQDIFTIWTSWAQRHSAATVRSTITSRTLLLGRVTEHARSISTSRQVVLVRQIARLRVSIAAMESVLGQGKEAASAEAVEESVHKRRT